MKVGVTGHQLRPGIDWAWVERGLRDALTALDDVESGVSSLAAGADQAFAGVALDLGIRVVAVVPLDDYERYFDDNSLRTYRRLIARCARVDLHHPGDPEHAFLEAGRFIVRTCDLMFAVWDGEVAAGVGGTGDIVSYARELGRPIVHLDPFEMNVRRI